MKTPGLTLFYDGHCPFCLAEIRRLRRWNKEQKLAFVDMAQADFDPAYLGVSLIELNAELHSLTRDGKLLVGVDSMLQAYALVDKGWIVFPLRIRFLRPMLAYLYRKFARHRYKISSMLGYQAVVVCKDDVCANKNLF